MKDFSGKKSAQKKDKAFSLKIFDSEGLQTDIQYYNKQ